MSWHLLPAEIRNLILDAVVEVGDNLGSAAAVSREWQHAIEPHTFAHIRLPVSRIPQLNLMTQRNQSLVRSIWFCIELKEYDCTKCVDKGLNAIETSSADNELILEAFRLLFSALSTWKPNKGNLTLDISLYSNSDTEHAYKYLTIEPDVPARATQPGVDQPLAVERQDKHRWEALDSGLLVPPDGTLERLFADVWLPFDEERDCWQQAPKVQAVTRLVMRLQTRRRLQPYTVIRMLSRLIGLRELHYELWRHHFDEMQEWLDEDFVKFLSVTEGMDKVILFEHTNQRFLARYLEGTSPVRIRSVSLGQQLARVNLGARSLSVSSMIDARDFFSIPPSTWCNLAHIALTSQCLSPEMSPTTIMNLLQAAARAAHRMPKLKTMEVWNGLEGIAALFKYESIPSRRSSVLTWRATWSLTLEDEVLSAWEEVVGDRINVVYESVVPGEIMTPADAVVGLKLSEMVVRPVSLRQILREESFIRSMAAQLSRSGP